MATSNPCPDVQVIERLMVGLLSDKEMDVLEKHVLACERCSATIVGVKVEDTLTDALRAAAQSQGKSPPELVHKLIEQLKKLPGSAAESASGTRPLEGAGTAQPDLTDFLSAPQGPDELGRLGPYRVLKVLGAGGMGVVFLAEDPQLQRLVALKAMKPALAASDTARQRFVREARAAAGLKHDHVVTIHQVGEDRGIPFLAIELLEGEALDARLKREGKLSQAEVVRIGREVAEGLAAAHERRLIHRDIKPGNIWLEGKRGRVKILDFGLARSTGDDSHLTQSGAIVGTPAYMAPEQANGEPIDARCDLFSLGCVLYRMATGHVPFKGADTMSTLLALAMHDPKPPRDLAPELAPPLADLIMKLLRKDRQERPATAAAVVEALERVTVTPSAPAAPASASRSEEQTAVLSRPSLPRRGKRPLIVAAGVFLLALVGLSVMFSFKTRHGTVVINVTEPDVQVFVDGEEKIVIDSRKVGRLELTPGPHELLVKRGKEELYTESFTLKSGGEAVIEAKWTPKSVAAPAPAVPAVNTGASASAADLLRREDIPAYELAVAGDGDPQQAPPQLVAVLGDSRMKHWSQVDSVNFSPDGKSLVSSGPGQLVRVWDVATGKQEKVFGGHSSHVIGVEYRRDGQVMASASWSDRKVKIWEAATGKELQSWTAPDLIVAMAFSKDGRFVASGHQNGDITLWDTTTKKSQQLTGHKTRLGKLAFNLSGSLLASADRGNAGKLWDTATGKELHSLSDVGFVTFSPDGRLLATTGKVAAKLWNPESGAELKSLPGTYWPLAFSSDGKILAGSGPRPRLGVIKFWNVNSWKEVRTITEAPSISEHFLALSSLAFSPDDRLLAMGSQNMVRVWDIATGQILGTLGGYEHQAVCAAIAPDGRTLAVGNVHGAVTLWSLVNAKQLATFRAHKERVLALAYSPDGQTLATASSDGINLWNSTTFAVLQKLPGTPTYAVAFSPDGRTLVSGGDDKNLRLWDVTTGKLQRTLTGHKARITSVAFDRHGALASASLDRAIKLWDAVAGEELRTLTGHAAAVLCLALSPDGKQLASGGGESGSGDYSVRLWDPASGKELRTLTSHRNWVNSAAFRPDGQVLASISDDGTVVLRDTATGSTKETIRLARDSSVLRQVLFTPDGRHLITVNGNGMLYVLRLGPAPAGASGSAFALRRRRAAEWVLSVGGTLTVVVDDRTKVIKDVNELPAGAFEISSISLNRYKLGADAEHFQMITDAGLQNLQGLAELKYLSLHLCSQITDAGLRNLENSKQLQSLDLQNAQVTSAGLASLRGMHQLEKFNLINTKVDDAGLEHLRGLPRLASLELQGTRVSNAGFKRLQDMPSLTALRVSGDLTEEGVKNIVGIAGLVDLNLLETTISDAMVAHLKELKLSRLSFKGSKKISDSGLAHLVGMTTLTAVDVRATAVTADGVKKLQAALPKCKIESDVAPAGEETLRRRKAAEWVLSVGGTLRVAHADKVRQVKAIADLPAEPFEIPRIDLNFSKQVTNAGLQNLRGLTELTYLSLHLCVNVSDEGLRHLEESQNLTALDLHSTRVSGAGMKSLSNMKALESLVLIGTKVNDAGLAFLEGLTEMRDLHLSPLITDAAVPSLKRFPHLRHLHVGGQSITDLSLPHIQQISSLQSLGLFGDQITEAGLEHLKGMKQLTTLYLVDLRKVGDSGLERIKGLKNLEKLSIQCPQVTDAGLEHLKGLTQLKSLELKKTKVTADGVKKLQAALPKCKIQSDVEK